MDCHLGHAMVVAVVTPVVLCAKATKKRNKTQKIRKRAKKVMAPRGYTPWD